MLNESVPRKKRPASIDSNAGGLQVYEDLWVDWEDADGNNIDEHFDNQEG